MGRVTTIVGSLDMLQKKGDGKKKKNKIKLFNKTTDRPPILTGVTPVLQSL
jgi:hypothetical protein